MKKYFPLLITVLVVIIIATAITTSANSKKDNLVAKVDTQEVLISSPSDEVTIITGGDPVASQSFDNLVNSAQIIAIGSITPSEEVVNMARNPNDVNQPDPTFYIIGQVYHFKVDEYLFGSGADSLKIVQPEGTVRDIDSRTVSAEAINKGKGLGYRFVPLSNTTYLVFLEQLNGFDTTYKTGSGGIPWRFIIEADTIKPESGEPELNAMFNVSNKRAMIQQINDLLEGKK